MQVQLKRKESVIWSLRWAWRGSCGVCLRRWERGGVQRWIWRGPRTLCYHGGDWEEACERSGFGGLIMSDGVWCCSSTTAMGPAWWWPSLCGAICFSHLPIGAESRPDIDYMRWRKLVTAVTRLLSVRLRHPTTWFRFVSRFQSTQVQSPLWSISIPQSNRT